MSTDLKERPEGIYDDEDKQAREAASLRDLEEGFAQPAISDEDRNAGGDSASVDDLKTSEGKTHEKLKDKPDSPKSGSKSESDSSDRNSGGGGLYNAGKKRIKGNLTGALSSTRAKVGIAIATAIISCFTMLITMGPGFLMNHLKEVLLNRISSVQMHHQRKYRQKNIHRLKNMWSADGRKAQKIVDEMTARGYKFSFDKKTGNIVGLQHPLKNTGAIGEGIGKEFDDFLETRHPFRTARWKTKRTEALYKTFGVKRTSPVDKQKIKAGPDGDVDTKKIVNSEMAKGVLEGEDPDLNVAKGSSKDANETDQADRDTANADYEEASGEIGEEAKEAAEDVKAGKSIDEITDGAGALVKSGGMLTDEVGEIAKEAAAGNLGSKIGSSVKGFLNPLDLGDRICTVRNRINGAVMLARSAKAVKLIRYTMLFINAADDTRRGRADSKAVNELMQRLTAKDNNGQYVGGSPGFGYLLKSKFSKSKNDASRSPVAVDGELSGFMGSVHSATTSLSGIDSACPFVQNPAIQVGAGVASFAAAIFSGGSSSIAKEGAVKVMKEAVEKVIKDMTVKQLLVTVGKTLAVELSFEAIMTLTEMYIQQNLNLPFTGQEKGGQLGDILVAGAGTSNKQRSLEAGMVPATTQQYAAANTEYLAWKKEEDSKKSFTERAFAMDNADSIAFNVAMAVPWNAGDAASEGFNKSLSVASSALNPSKILTSFMTAISPKASALDGDEISIDEVELKDGPHKGTKLATDPAGNPQVIMRSDIEDIDPIANRDALIKAGEIDSTTYQPKEGSGFAKHIELCITTPDSYTNLEDKDEGDCLAEKEITKQYKAHLAFLDLSDGLEAEFFPSEIETTDSGGATPSAPTGTNTGGVIVGDPYADTTSVPCAEGTKDIGVQDAYRNGTMFKSRMCSVLNFPSGGQADNPGSTFSTPGADGHAIVNSRVSGAWFKLINDAKAAGINFTANSSFRSMPHQRSLFAANPNPKYVATPGSSPHQAGVAIDFFNMGGKGGQTCASRATNPGDGYKWLRDNAIKYGFKQYSAEAWHWDALPAANRC